MSLSCIYVPPYPIFDAFKIFLQLFRRIVAKEINIELYTNIGDMRKSCLSTILQY